MAKNDRRTERWLLAGLTAAAVAASGIAPHDRLTWFLEVSWVLVGLALVLLAWRRYPVTPLLWRLAFLHALVLIVGGYYTYARVPLGLWAQEAWGWQRNHYDRLGHLFQGFVPAILAREVLIRSAVVRGQGWLFLLVTCVCLAFSAFFELLEWWAAVAYGDAAAAYLATQGDVWDTQWDMFLALVGAIVAQLTLARLHNRQIAQLGQARASTLAATKTTR